MVVFGGSGFIGSHVADQLTKFGYDVTIFDKTVSPWLRTEQKMLVGDLLDKSEVVNAVTGNTIVYNFAAISDLDDAANKAIETASVNVLGNTFLLEACKSAGVQRYVYASTVYVYSREGGFYRCSKQAAELYVEEYQRTYGLDYTILRFGSITAHAPIIAMDFGELSNMPWIQAKYFMKDHLNQCVNISMLKMPPVQCYSFG